MVVLVLWFPVCCQGDELMDASVAMECRSDEVGEIIDSRSASIVSGGGLRDDWFGDEGAGFLVRLLLHSLPELCERRLD